MRTQSKPKGGQKSHQDKIMQQIPNPDKIVVHQVENCYQCGNELKEKPANHIIKRLTILHDLFIRVVPGQR